MGFFTILSAYLTGPAGQVVAVEPNAVNCRYIEASRRYNKFDHLTVHCVAASDNSGLLVLNSSYSNGSVAVPGSSLAALMRSQMVPGVRLDDLVCLDRLNFIKIDVEGFELSALLGFRKNIIRHRPVIVSEFGPTGMPDGAAYLRFLREMDYNIAVIEEDGNILDCFDDSAVMTAWKLSGVDHVDLLAVPN